MNSVVGLNLNLKISSDKRLAILFVFGLLKFKPFDTGLNNEISTIGFGREYTIVTLSCYLAVTGLFSATSRSGGIKVENVCIGAGKGRAKI